MTFKELIEKLGVGRRPCHPGNTAKRFRDDQKSEEAYEAVDRGIRSVPLDKIVGSVGRYHDFDSHFRLRNFASTERLDGILQAMRQGKYLPPVKLYQIKEEYYVLDGNHRVAAAKALCREKIDARILEFIPSKNTLENILYREKSEFREKTGLDVDISLTELGQYARLMEQIAMHQAYLQKETRGEMDFQTAAADWYETIYCPLTAILRKGNLLEKTPGRTLGDLYAYISYHHWEREGADRRYGIGFGEFVPKDMEAFRKKMSELKETEYPEMLREITAFILINITARKEDRIVEKLFAIDEIKELHSVHGNVDILVKAVIQRDILSSDAETIGQFVQNKVRQISGIVTTQTLIPGFSKIKKQ